MKTILKTTHRLESGKTVILPKGLKVTPASNLPSESAIKFWLAELPSALKLDPEAESHFQNIGFGFSSDEVDAPPTCKVQFEYTDTFGGEANYSWVRRKEMELPESISDRALVRRAKAWAGLTGHPCRTENFGDLIALYPSGCCTVLFISTIY